MAVEVEKLDHVTYQVWDIQKAMEIYQNIFGSIFTDLTNITKTGWDLVGTIDQFGQNIIAPISPKSKLTKYLNKRGEGVASVAFKVYNLEQAENEMQKNGVRQVVKYQSPNWKPGNYREIYYHPKDCFGVLVCLCEYEPRLHSLCTAEY